MTSVAMSSIAKTSIAKTSISISGGVGGSSIGVVSGGIGGKSMSISCGISVSNWESSSNLSNGVSISLRFGFSLTLSIVVPGISVSKSRVGVDSWGGNDSGVSSDSGSSMSIGGSSYNSNIVGMSSGISVSNWESSSNLSDGVSISLRLGLSLTLSIVVPGISVGRGGVSMDSRGVTVGRGSSNHMVCIAKMSKTSIP